MSQKFLTVGELIELLKNLDKDKSVAYFELEYGTTPIVGVTDNDDYVYIDGAC